MWQAYDGLTVFVYKVMSEEGLHKLVFSSSATVYGVPEYLPLDEAHRTGECTNPYGTTKYAVEKMMMELAASHEPQLWTFSLLRWVMYPYNTGSLPCLRYFNPAGAHETGDIGEDPLGVPNNLMPYIAQVRGGLWSNLA